MNQKSTVKPTQTSHVRETVVLESKRATVTNIRWGREWLMRDCLSTPYATVIRS